VKTYADEFAPKTVRVIQLVPGRIATERLAYLDEEQRKRWMAATPMGRYGEPMSSRARPLLLSDAASYITGATQNTLYATLIYFG
jgi:3-oxoacyl-[acyl-carrier protein] reductase